MVLTKKTLTLLVTLATLVISMGSGLYGLTSVTGSGITPQASSNTAIYLTGSDVVGMDPHIEYDSASIDVFDQLTETLFEHNLTDPGLNVIPKLAVSYLWAANKTKLTLNLRSGVLFHDGTPFNATAAKWNLERMMYFFNWTQNPTTLPAPFNANVPSGGTLSKFSILFESPDPLIEKVTEDMGNNSISIYLDQPSASFLSILSYAGVAMLSVKSTPATTPISTHPVGTGPFTFVSRTPGERIEFAKNTNYWRTAAQLDGVIFRIISDQQTRTTALYNLEGSIIDAPTVAMIPLLNSSKEITVQKGASLTINYIGMNNLAINKTWRKAISLAFDYDYLVNQVGQGRFIREHGAIPLGMPYYNGSIPYTTQNLVTARQTLIDHVLTGATKTAAITNLNNNAWWTALSTTTPLNTFNYTYNVENQVRRDTGTLLRDSLKLIGCNTTLIGLTWDDYINKAYDPVETYFFGLFMIGWAPDYIDPDNYLSPLMSSASLSNEAHINDAALDTLIFSAKTETNTTIRQQLYNQIQNYTQNELYPWIFGLQGVRYTSHLKDFNGFPGNPMARVVFYPCSFGSISGYHFGSAPFSGFLQSSGSGTDSLYLVMANSTTVSGDETFAMLLSAKTTGAVTFVVGFWEANPISLGPGFTSDAHAMYFYISPSDSSKISGSVTVIFKLTDAMKADLAASAFPAESIALYMWSDTSNTWVETLFPVQIIGGGFASITLSHFTTFALGLESYTPPPETTVPGYDVFVLLAGIAVAGLVGAYKLKKHACA